MRKVLVVVLAVAIVGSLAAAALPLAERYAAGQIKAAIEQDGQTSVGAVEVGLLRRRVILTDVHSQAFGGLTARRWEARGFPESFGDLLEGRTPFTDFKLGDPLRADHFELADARFTDSDGSNWSVGSLSVDGLDLAPYDPNVAGPYRLQILTARIAKALKLRHVEATNVSYGLAATGDSLAMRRVAIDRFDHGSLGTLVIVGSEAVPRNTTDAAFKIDDMRAKDVDLKRVVAQLGERSWQPGRPLGRVAVSSASASGFGGTLLSRNGVSLEGVSLETTHEAVDSSRSRLRIDDLILRPAGGLEGARLRLVLQAMGLAELKLGFDCAGVERRGKGELGIDRCALAMADLGEVSLAANFTGADETFWRAIDDGDAMLLSRSAIALASARVTVADKGMIDRSVRALAAGSGQSSQIARANLARDIRTYQPPDILITEDLTKLFDTVARFVEQGGTLALEAKPDPPLGLAAARGLSITGPDLVSLLGLSATLSR
ncbi:MAG: hypothetical protein J0H44_03410 [Alphaproteobacteria bacterium]|nr:hypothetical protein [Alphaproteobacteria bacterium]